MRLLQSLISALVVLWRRTYNYSSTLWGLAIDNTATRESYRRLSSVSSLNTRQRQTRRSWKSRTLCDSTMSLRKTIITIKTQVITGSRNTRWKRLQLIRVAKALTVHLRVLNLTCRQTTPLECWKMTSLYWRLLVGFSRSGQVLHTLIANEKCVKSNL